MSARHFEMLMECFGCGRMSHTSVILYLLMADERMRFCSVGCRTRYLDTHPSDLGVIDPRYEGR